MCLIARAPVLLFLALVRRFVACATASAAPPSPIDSRLFGFPGAFQQPPSARSAGWPARDELARRRSVHESSRAEPRRGVMMSPALVRMNRQDLRGGEP